MTAPTPSRGPQPGRIDGFWLPVVALIAVIALSVAVLATFLPESTVTTTGSGSAGGETTFEVELSEFTISPSAVTVPAGQELTFTVTNKGAMPHDFAVGGKNGTKMLQPGEHATLTVAGLSASGAAWCTVPGHKESGMVMSITVAGAAARDAGASTTTPAATGVAIDPNAMPSDGWKPYDPTLRPAPGAKEHKITLHATEKVLEIAPGVKQEMWTFGDTVPGPVLRGKVGDIFTVTLINDGKVGHSIDFHASEVAMDTKMRTIASGERLVYQFTANHSGVWMYHCGTAPVLHHIGNGMYGAVVIDPPDLPAVDHEYLFVQSDLYLTKDHKLAGLDAMLAEQWDAVVWNGYYNQYKFEPITTAKPGERVRIWVLDAGPSENSAFHIVGTQFDTVFKEGAYLLRKGNPEIGGSQTLDLQPAQGGFVEFAFPEDGTFAQVTHKFASASKGAVAIWHVGTVPDAPTGSGSGH